jgi:hypothetical protein
VQISGTSSFLIRAIHRVAVISRLFAEQCVFGALDVMGRPPPPWLGSKSDRQHGLGVDHEADVALSIGLFALLGSAIAASAAVETHELTARVNYRFRLFGIT